MRSDIVVVGSGLTGAVIARTLTDADHRVLVVERRDHVGGNVHDHLHQSGVRVHTYGPHYFRTNSTRIWGFVRRFADFHPYEAVVKSLVDGRAENWPVAASYIARTVGPDWAPGFTGDPRSFEEAALSMMPRAIYEKFVRGYTEKQWGVAASTLSPKLAKRFDIRRDDEPRLMRHRYQGIPVGGYARFMEALLEGIPVALECDYLEHRLPARLLIYTGPIDTFFGHEHGRLAYRGQVRTHDYLADVEYALPCGQLNNPGPGAHIRTLEWKHMMPAAEAAAVRGTVLTREMTVSPVDEDAFEYPFPDERNAALYRRYRAMAASLPDVIICGRLGEYRYYDMDQAIARALLIAQRVLRGR